MLAQGVIDFPLTDTLKWVADAIGFMVLGITVMTFWLLCKKVFGPHPPMDKKLASLRKEIYEVNGRAKKELMTAAMLRDERIKDIAEEITEIKLDRERKWKELTGEMHTLAETLAFIRGKFEKSNHQNHEPR